MPAIACVRTTCTDRPQRSRLQFSTPGCCGEGIRAQENRWKL